MSKKNSYIKRLIKSGYTSFRRNIGINIATIFAIFLTITIITLLFLLNPISNLLISNIKEKINVSIYFEEGVEEKEILSIKEEIKKEKENEIKEVEYISSEMALESFIEKYKDNFTIMSSLSEIGTNPFLSSLKIKAYNIEDYENINIYIEEAPFNSLVNKIDYEERRPIIERIFSIAGSFKKAGLIISIFFGIIAVMFSFSSIKSAIYSAKEEISIMKLVGASNWFIKIPFLIQGAIVGFLSSLLSFFFFFLFTYFFNDKIENFASGISIFSIFVSNLSNVILIQFGTGVIIGVVSSFIAVKIHLSKV